MILEVIVYALDPSPVAQRAAERVADSLLGERELVNRGHAIFVRREMAVVDGWQQQVLVYVVHAHHRDDADGSRNDRWSLGSTGYVGGRKAE